MLKTSQKKVSLTSDVFPEIPAPKKIDKCLKSHVSDNPSTDNKANGSKHCCNRNDSAFTIFINHCEGNCVWKILFK